MVDNDLDYTFSSGGEDELQYAIKLYGYSLLRYCHNITCDYFEAQDIVQITFIKAYKNRQSFKSGTNLSAWLYSIAYNTCIDFLRKKKIKKKLLFFINQTKNNDDSKFMSDELKSALLKLTPQERALIFSRVIDEKSYSDLETIYHTSAITLRKRYQRAKTKLSKILKETNFYYSKLGGKK